MEKIVIFFGPKKEFEKELINLEYLSLSKVVRDSDIASKAIHIVNNGESVERKVPYIENLVIFSDEYMSVNEHVISNFIGFINEFDIDNLYLHNPPQTLETSIINSYECFERKIFEFEKLNNEVIANVYNDFNKNIIGQDKVRDKIVSALLPLRREKNDKPIILMFFGASGIGKTATAKFLADKVGGNLFRRQCSMFQNNEFLTYLFGGKHNEKCLAKELLERESNVILLDEFDKAPKVFHSAFYQLFDEGVFEDKNYSVNLRNSIIICTSNYQSINEIQRELGDPIYSRFNLCIKFSDLSIDSINKIIEINFDDLWNDLEEDEKKFLNRVELFSLIMNNSGKLKNVRNIRNIISELFSIKLIEMIIKEIN